MPGHSTSDRRFFLTNPDRLFVAYDGLVLAVEKRLSSGWQASASYTYSMARGLQVMSNGAADLRVSKTLSVGTAGSVDLILDVLNLLDDSAEERIVSDNLSSGTFGQPRLFIDPRRAMLGVRVNLGR